MSKGTILVVEPDNDIRNMIEIYFTLQGYNVFTLADRAWVWEFCLQKPDVIILNQQLSKEIDLTRRLNSNELTKYIPIIFLCNKDQRSDAIRDPVFIGDDIITIPFDIEELKLCVSNSVRSASLIDPFISVSGLPTGRLIEEHLRKLMREDDDFMYIDIKITNFDPFKEVYSWQAGEEAQRAVALIIADIIEAHGMKSDFAGHFDEDNFCIITQAEDIDTRIDSLQKRFDEEIQQHYSFIDRDRGFMLVEDNQVDFMSLAIGYVSTRTHDFADIREITELAQEDRRKRNSEADGE